MPASSGRGTVTTFRAALKRSDEQAREGVDALFRCAAQAARISCVVGWSVGPASQTARSRARLRIVWGAL